MHSQKIKQVIFRYLENKTYTTGEAITSFAGYNWHVISDDGSNVTLLMDGGQIEDMSHCGSNNDSSNNCTYNGSHYVYSWDKSLINSYLKNTLYPELKNKITNVDQDSILTEVKSHILKSIFVNG